jgi:hypothetical protein
MEQANEIKHLVGKIVDENFPQEKIVFEEFADNYLDKLKDDLEVDGAYSEFDGEILGKIAGAIGTLVSTIITILEFRKKNKTKNLELITDKWRLELVANGIPEANAKAITDKYGEELKKFVL